MHRSILCALALLLGCAAPNHKLTPEGERVWVSDREVLGPKCVFVKGVRCAKGGVYGAEENARLCRNNLRNQAAQAGGTHLVMNRERTRGTQFETVNSAVPGPNNALIGTRCLGCVQMWASVFRCEGSEGDVKSSRRL